MARVSQGINADRGKQPQLPAPCSVHSPRTPALASSADWFCQAQNAEKRHDDISTSCSLQMSMPLEELCLNLIMRQTKSSTISVT